jgi:hypothetical protein
MATTRSINTKKLIDYVSAESRTEYLRWKYSVEIEMLKPENRGLVAPVFWLDHSVEFLVGIYPELPDNVKRLLVLN